MNLEERLDKVIEVIQGLDDLVSYINLRLKEVENTIANSKDDNKNKIPNFSGVELLTIQYKLNDKTDVLFYNEVSYVCKIQLRTVVEGDITYIKMFKDGKVQANPFIVTQPTLPVEIKIDTKSIQYLYKGKVISTFSFFNIIPLHATFVKLI